MTGLEVVPQRVMDPAVLAFWGLYLSNALPRLRARMMGGAGVSTPKSSEVPPEEAPPKQE